MFLCWSSHDWNMWKPCVPNKTALGCSRPYQASFQERQTAGWKCPPRPPRTFTRSVLARSGTALILSAIGCDAAQSGMQEPTQSAARSRTRSIALALVGTGRSFACLMKLATLLKRTSKQASSKNYNGTASGRIYRYSTPSVSKTFQTQASGLILSIISQS